MTTNQVTCYNDECRWPFPHREGSRGCQYDERVLAAQAAAASVDSIPVDLTDRIADARYINQQYNN